MRQLRPIRHWFLAALAVLGAFLVAGIAGSAATGALGFWHLPGAGFSAALAVVLSAYLALPSRRFFYACCAFAIGAILAWMLLEPSWYPESYGASAYQPTHLPVIATYLGGLVGLAIAGVLSVRAGGMDHKGSAR